MSIATRVWHGNSRATATLPTCTGRLGRKPRPAGRTPSGRNVSRRACLRRPGCRLRNCSGSARRAPNPTGRSPAPSARWPPARTATEARRPARRSRRWSASAQARNSSPRPSPRVHGSSICSAAPGSRMSRFRFAPLSAPTRSRSRAGCGATSMRRCCASRCAISRARRSRRSPAISRGSPHRRSRCPRSSITVACARCTARRRGVARAALPDSASSAWASWVERS